MSVLDIVSELGDIGVGSLVYIMMLLYFCGLVYHKFRS